MNPSAEDWESEALDKRLFDYLEGNLPEEQARELEQKAAADALLGSELEYWKETKVTADMPDTRLLEEELLIAETMPANERREAGRGISAPLYLVAFLISLCSLWPVKLQRQAGRMQENSFRIPASKPISRKAVVAASIPVEKSGSRNPQNRKQYPAVKTRFSADKIDRTNLPSVARLAQNSIKVSLPLREVGLPEAALIKLALKKMPAARFITRKQARQVARMKERALQRRMAHEFLKGHVPYVVPLNTRNF